MLSAIKRIYANQSGVSITEFGLIAPVVAIMIMGTFDIGHQMYVNSVLNGALQEVGRDSALEGATNSSEQLAIDNKLKSIVGDVMPGAILKPDCEATAEIRPVGTPWVCVKRRYYKTFSEAAAAQAEDVIEDPLDADGKCDSGESFMDANHNGIWDEDGGTTGQGGAKDVVIIEVKIKYDRLFPAGKMIGYSNEVELVSDSVIANQPYGKQTQFAPPVSVECP
jgi:Flp pilus assembly pilin Flp